MGSPCHPIQHATGMHGLHRSLLLVPKDATPKPTAAPGSVPYTSLTFQSKIQAPAPPAAPPFLTQRHMETGSSKAALRDPARRGCTSPSAPQISKDGLLQCQGMKANAGDELARSAFGTCPFAPLRAHPTSRVPLGWGQPLAQPQCLAQRDQPGCTPRQTLTCTRLHLLPVPWLAINQWSPGDLPSRRSTQGGASATSWSSARFSQTREQRPDDKWEQLPVNSAFPEDLCLSKAVALQPEQVSVTAKSRGSYSI